MYEVDKNNNITATRGDAQKYSLDLKDPEGNVWQPEEGDTVRFAISTGEKSRVPFGILGFCAIISFIKISCKVNKK